MTSTGRTSTSLDRAPGPSNSFVRGKSGYVPFWPGGLDGISEDPVPLLNPQSQMGLRTVPPGFSRGLRFSGEVGAVDDAFLMDISDVQPDFPSHPVAKLEVREFLHITSCSLSCTSHLKRLQTRNLLYTEAARNLKLMYYSQPL
jgi:hypothetical protein